MRYISLHFTLLYFTLLYYIGNRALSLLLHWQIFCQMLTLLW